MFGRKNPKDHHDPAPAHGVRATALITDTDHPLDNLDSLFVRASKYRKATVRILVDTGRGPVVGHRTLALDEDHWLTVGLSAPVVVNPDDPDDFAIDWESLPGIAERAAAGEQSLVDPLGARCRSWEALVGAGHPTQYMTMVDPSVRETAAAARKAQLDEAPHRLGEQLAAIAQEPAASGTRRAVVVIATTTATLKQDGDGEHDTGAPVRDTHGKHSVVLSVHIPGAAPYAVFVERFDHPTRAPDPRGPGIPALVSLADPRAVTVLWDELPTFKDVQREAKAWGKAQNAAAADLRASMPDRIAAATQAASSGGGLTVPAGVGAMLTPQAKEMMARTAKQALAQITDPTQRRMVIDNYKQLGIEIDEEGSG